MAEVPQGVKDVAAWVDLKELDDHGTGLTQFEIDFVESLHGTLRAGRMLTEKQAAKLEQIRGARL
jgi:hypothetical protein